MQVGTYPTRNFAQNCCLPVFHEELALTEIARSRRIGHFCRPLHVAMQLGLSLAWRSARPRRVVSEGSIPSGTTSLLIVRTGRIVTVAVATSSAGFSEFPAYSQVLLRLAFTQTLGPFTVVTPPSRDGVAGSFRFRPALTVAREVGPSHLAGRSAVELGVWPLRIPSIRLTRARPVWPRWTAFPADCPHRARCHFTVRVGRYE